MRYTILLIKLLDRILLTFLIKYIFNKIYYKNYEIVILFVYSFQNFLHARSSL